jgi:hypothetical protein
MNIECRRLPQEARRCHFTSDFEKPEGMRNQTGQLTLALMQVLLEEVLLDGSLKRMKWTHAPFNG